MQDYAQLIPPALELPVIWDVDRVEIAEGERRYRRLGRVRLNQDHSLEIVPTDRDTDPVLAQNVARLNQLEDLTVPAGRDPETGHKIAIGVSRGTDGFDGLVKEELASLQWLLTEVAADGS
ncbi:MAG: hypothetical protein KI792_12265 [Alphaproteobacteria bacterium]|nr:hypothetical protein [Alphaproteobacteria bacterium SS10]